LAGVKTTDGETGSVGPQVAEALSEMLQQSVPHATYVHDFQVLPGCDGLTIEHRIASSIRTMQAVFPALLTIASEYRSGIPATSDLRSVRRNNYRGKILSPAIWDAKMIEADPACLGLAGSPTWVGAGYDVGGPPSQRYIASTKIISADLDTVSIGGKTYGPFKKGQLINELDSPVLEYLENKRLVKTFDYSDLMDELFGDSNNGAGV
jgi:electron transfer flavoprotein beta subunit